ncbi:hypothetical protein ONS95_002542 [Cadophora gregata]|uniref:uncharacterized protein n=1 Tax=Cadophora gregata TaxID=51156 RepID=UPI0026DB550F|nr:uncharacterized protein ONS95_002542 [Cadophora gregata]KAK0109871.1 hypothetical protein ONS95_002542 [Cadophora gregata]
MECLYKQIPKTVLRCIPNRRGCSHHPRQISTSQRLHDSHGALHGIKILDMSRVLAGPLCTQILADYGADVIKVEQPGQGDDTRYWRVDGETSTWGHEEKLSYYFAAVNRNKRSFTLDVKQEEGRKVLLNLAMNSDVLVENFIPGKMEQFGLGYDTLGKLNRSLIYASISGIIIQNSFATEQKDLTQNEQDTTSLPAAAEAGLLHITGEHDGPPTEPGVALTDISTGLYTHGAILAALQARHRTGKGQKIDCSLFDTQLLLLTSVAKVWLNMKKEATRFGTEHPSIVPLRILLDCWDVELLAEDERFGTNDKRNENRAALKVILDECFARKTTEKWLEALE